LAVPQALIWLNSHLDLSGEIELNLNRPRGLSLHLPNLYFYNKVNEIKITTNLKTKKN
jgi:hypothetical protein